MIWLRGMSIRASPHSLKRGHEDRKSAGAVPSPLRRRTAADGGVRLVENAGVDTEERSKSGHGAPGS